MLSSRPSCRRATAGSVALLGALVISSVASAAYWGPTIVITEHTSRLDDLTASGQHIAVAYRLINQEGEGRGIVRESTDGGSSFDLVTRPARAQDSWVIEMALDSGGGRHWAAWTEILPSQQDPWRRRIFVGGKGYGDVQWTARAASPFGSFMLRPTVAYGPRRLFLTYNRGLESMHAYVTHAPTGAGAFSAPMDLGRTNEFAGNGTPHVDATASTVAVVWTAPDGDVRFKRGLIGAGPGVPVTWEPTRRMGRGGMPRVAIDGDRVAVISHREDGIFFQGSTDGGATFGPFVWAFREAGSPEGGWFNPSDIAMDGQRIVVSTQVSTPDEPDRAYRVLSFNGGNTWTTVATPADVYWRHVALGSAGGTSKVAEVWQSGDSTQPIFFHRQQ